MARGEALARVYRPKKFSEVVEQDAIKQILMEQIRTDQLKRVLLFTGPAGCGKTTNGRILAREIEPCKSNIIEINCADHTGIDDVRTLIIEQSKSKPLQGKYKIFILDECHSFTVQSQNALLKLLEEPPVYCIFILCTTDPQKILTTILSRAYRYDFQKISFDGIVNRLNYILEQERNNPEGCGIQSWDQDAIKYIAKTSNGGLRDAITLCDKVISYSKNIKIDDVINVLGVTGYDIQFDLLDSLISKDQNKLTCKLQELYQSGKDTKLFIRNLLTFILDVNKFIITNSFDYISIPSTYSSRLSIYNNSNRPYLKELLTKLIQLNTSLKWETNARTLLESTLLLEVL